MCYVYVVIVGIFLNVLLMNFCVILVDRYYFIMSFLFYRDIVICCRIVVSIVFVWFYFVFWVIVFLFGWGEYIYEVSIVICKLNWNGEGFVDKLYVLCLVVICFLVFVLVMIFVYLMIYKIVRK